MKRLIVDLDNTICVSGPSPERGASSAQKYREAVPVAATIDALRRYRELGFEIVVHTSRNMRTYEGDVEKIREFTLPAILDWLALHDVPYDEVVVGKPWCGFDGFYVDDRAVRPSEFASMTYEEIRALIDRETAPK